MNEAVRPEFTEMTEETDIPETQDETAAPEGDTVPETAVPSQTPETGAAPETDIPQEAPEEAAVPETETVPDTDRQEGSEEAAQDNDPEPPAPTGEEVAEAVLTVLEAAGEMELADPDGIERLQDYITETRTAYEELTEEEQEALAGSMAYLEDASVAVDTMQLTMEQEETGTIVIPQTGLPNSWRFINGKPLAEALQTAEEEAEIVAQIQPEAEPVEEEEEEPEQEEEITVPETDALPPETEEAEPADGLVNEPETETDAAPEILPETEEDTAEQDAGEPDGEADSAEEQNGPELSVSAGAEVASLRVRTGSGNGEVFLVGTGTALKGIDVSQWQDDIDWAAVKSAGIKYAIIRCGYGSDYESQDDWCWEQNATACEQLGIPYGVYLYSYATTNAMIDSEAEHTLRLLKGHKPALPIYLDLEDNSQTRLGNAKMSAFALRWCKAIKKAGYKRVGIYANLYWWNNLLFTFANEYNTADTYYQWVAQYNDTCDYTGHKYECWQYSSSGKVKGITGNVDMNWWYEDLPKAGSNAASAASTTGIAYRSYIQSFGWEGSWKKNGAVSGTVGNSLRLEGIRIKMTGERDLGVQYRTRVQGSGWENTWHADGETSGAPGKGKRIEAVQIKLTGADAAKYDLYYCVQTQRLGWLNWAKNGAKAGTSGYDFRIEAIRIKLVKKGAAAPAKLGNYAAAFKQTYIRYNTHVQTYGWMDYVVDGAMSGTTGQSKRLEGIHIQLTEKPYSGNVEYRTHVQTYGWQKWVKNGALSGTVGKAKRLEAIQIRLTGEMAQKYDIYYQTHIQTFGWTGWAKNGAACGSAGYGKRLEGIRIKLVSKGGKAPASTTTKVYYRKK